MIETRIPRTACTSLLLVALLLLGIVALAEEPHSSDPGKSFGGAYDSTQEITIGGIVQEIISHPAHGGAVGLHLLISTGDKTVDAHVGPFLSQENREALAPGESVEIVGVNSTSHGQSLFLVRQLIVGKRQITVRNQRGFLVRPAPQRATQINKPVVNGGAQ